MMHWHHGYSHAEPRTSVSGLRRDHAIVRTSREFANHRFRAKRSVQRRRPSAPSTAARSSGSLASRITAADERHDRSRRQQDARFVV